MYTALSAIRQPGGAGAGIQLERLRVPAPLRHCFVTDKHTGILFPVFSGSRFKLYTHYQVEYKGD